MSSAYAPNPSVIATELPGELILLDPATQEMFSLNETGRAVWRALPDHSPDEIARLLAESFEVTVEEAEADVRRLLEGLLAARLLLPRPPA